MNRGRAGSERLQYVRRSFVAGIQWELVSSQIPIFIELFVTGGQRWGGLAAWLRRAVEIDLRKWLGPVGCELG